MKTLIKKKNGNKRKVKGRKQERQKSNISFPKRGRNQ